jgi:D-alanyl-D-alanine carboxypeptidase
MQSEAPRGLRWGSFSLVFLLAMTAVSSDPADARGRRKRGHHRQHATHHVHRGSHPVRAKRTDSLTPGYAAIVVDGNSGRVMHATNADALRHPASLTKIMTLYLLFERLDAGKLRLDTPLSVSEHAAAQSPTKLGLKPGTTISVEDAIKGMVTRSANDAAVVVAENLGGSEGEFGRMMTRKAQALGMSRTVYVNASGLPNDEQITTASDQATLGRAIQERFPRYYRYFSTRTFSYHGQSIGNHNHLLGRVDGVDGIKTGYTAASGFNLVTSVHRDNRYLVAVVLGGASGGSRDARMRALIEENIADASTRRTAAMVAEAAPSYETASVPAEAKAAAPAKIADRFGLAGLSAPVRADNAPAAALTPTHAAPGSADPIRPVAIKTLAVKPGTNVRTAGAVPVQLPKSAPVQDAASETAAAAPARGSFFGLFNARVGAANETAPPPVQEAAVVPGPAPTTERPAAAPAPSVARAVARVAPAARVAPVAAPPKAQVHNGWIIQVGAYPAEEEAKRRLATVRSKAARLLGGADPFTESVLKGEKTFYRARFAGLDKDRAEAACNYLKRNDVECLAIKN